MVLAVHVQRTVTTKNKYLTVRSKSWWQTSSYNKQNRYWPEFSRFLPSTSAKDICCYPVVFKDKLYSYRLKNKTSRLYRTQSPQQPRLPIHKHVAFFEEQGYKSTIKKQKFMLAWSSFWLAKCQDTFGSDFRSSQDKSQAGQCFNIVLGAPKPFTRTSLGGGHFITTSQIQFN